MSGAKVTSPNVAGIATASVIKKPFAYSLLCASVSSEAFKAESLGKNTVAIAIVKTPSGNSKSLLAKYSAGIAESLSHSASILDTKIFTCMIAAPARAGTKRAYSSPNSSDLPRSNLNLHPFLYVHTAGISICKKPPTSHAAHIAYPSATSSDGYSHAPINIPQIMDMLRSIGPIEGIPKDPKTFKALPKTAARHIINM